MPTPISLQLRIVDPDGPFAAIIDSYDEHLRNARHGSRRRYLASIVHFGQWLTGENLGASQVDEMEITRFLTEHLPICTCPRPSRSASSTSDQPLTSCCACSATMA